MFSSNSLLLELVLTVQSVIFKWIILPWFFSFLYYCIEAGVFGILVLIEYFLPSLFLEWLECSSGLGYGRVAVHSSEVISVHVFNIPRKTSVVLMASNINCRNNRKCWIGPLCKCHSSQVKIIIPSCQNLLTDKWMKIIWYGGLSVTKIRGGSEVRYG